MKNKQEIVFSVAEVTELVTELAMRRGIIFKGRFRTSDDMDYQGVTRLKVITTEEKIDYFILQFDNIREL